MKSLDYFLQDLRIRKALPHIGEDARVLDIGCYDTRLFDRLGSKLAYGVGIDPLAPEMETDRYRLIPKLFGREHVGDEPFHAITMLAVVEHIPESELAVLARDCFAVLRPQGKVIITVPDKRVDHILEVLVALRLIDGMSVHEHHAFDIRRVPEFFLSAGFTNPVHEPFELGLNNLFVFTKPE